MEMNAIQNLVGMDLGNRYAKLKSDNGTDELIMSWREITETDYKTAEIIEGMEKVKYKNKYYIIGLTGTKGINNRNKGHQDVIEMSNMFKLVLLARELRSRGQTEGEYKAVTGTPYDDFEKNYNDYINLMKSPDNKEEIIELDGQEYHIKVTAAEVTKQGACVILTIADRKTKNYLIFDWGGETLDVSFFEKGVRITGLTLGFALNRLYVELAKELNKYMDIARPNLNDARFMKDMETLKLEGHYRNITTFNIGDTVVSLSQYVSQWFQEKVDDIIDQTINELDINSTDLYSITPVHIGGGAKLLEKEITKNTKLTKTSMAELPEYRNVIAYYQIAKALKNWK